jgi:hypothetical protein
MSDGLAEKELRERYQVDSTVTYERGLVVLHLSPEAFEQLLDDAVIHENCVSAEGYDADLDAAELTGRELGIEEGYENAIDDFRSLHVGAPSSDDVPDDLNALYQAVFDAGCERGYDDALSDIAALAEEGTKAR